MGKTEHARLTAAEFTSRLLALPRPLVLMHCRPDGDTVGSAAALYHLLRAAGKAPVLLCADPIPPRLQFLLPDAAPTYDPASRYDGVAVDVASPAQLGALTATLTEAQPICLMLDHHELGTPFADGYICPTAAACGELVWEIAEQMLHCGAIGEIPGEATAAVYAALSSDTGCFRFANTTPHTLRTAACLLEAGVVADEINRCLFECKGRSLLLAEGVVASRIATDCGGRFAYAVLPLALRSEAGLSESDFETAIDIVRCLEGAEVAAVLKETAPGVYKISLRSTGPDVAAVCACFGGGGHRRAAGCTVKAASSEEAFDMLRCRVEALFSADAAKS